MAKEAYYFSHDANARTDPKILQMRSVYKSEGYGWYWMFIEKMREEADYTLSMQGKYVWNAFALEMDASAERIRTFVEDCICEFKLFESDGTKFWSNSLLERMKIRETKSEKARQSAEARWKKNKETQENQPLEQTDSESNANASKNDAIKESKVKEIKEKKRDIIKAVKIQYAEAVKMSEEEYNKLIETHGGALVLKMIDTLNNYKLASGKTYKDDYRAILNWVVKRVLEENVKVSYGKSKPSNFNNFEQRQYDASVVEELQKQSYEGLDGGIDPQEELRKLRGK